MRKIKPRFLANQLKNLSYPTISEINALNLEVMFQGPKQNF